MADSAANAAADSAHNLVTRQSDPFNAETPLAALGAAMTPDGLFYVRNHLPVPAVDLSTWRLVIDGAVDRPMQLGWPELAQLPARRLTVTLECAGNGRAYTARPAEGTPWEYGATATAEFSGAPLAALLERAGLRPEAVEILFTGADQGEVEPGRQDVYARSLPTALAQHPDVLLAWAMNGQPLPTRHGFPLRLVVPGWYGVASVKWLVRITALAKPYGGYYQRERYVYVGEAGLADGVPVTEMRVRSVIAEPADGARLQPGKLTVAGSAWSGQGPVQRVDVSTDGGATWQPAVLGPAASRYAARPWQIVWTPRAAGTYTLMARATDAAGHVQPLEPGWNRYGYGNNAVQRVQVTVA